MPSTPKLPLLVAPDILPHFVLPSSSGDTSVDGINMGAFDFDRLAFLGSGAIQLAVTKALFDNEKHLNADLEDLLQMYTEPRMWARWGSLYGNFPTLGHGLGDDEADGARLFSAYVGGIYHQDDMGPIHIWIQKLIAHSRKEDTMLNSLTTTPKERVATTAVEPDGTPGPPSSPVSSTTLQHASTGVPAPLASTQTSSPSRKRERETSSGGERSSSPSPKRTRVSSATSNTPSRNFPARYATVSEPSSSSSAQPNPVIGHITPLNITAAEIFTASSSRASTSSAAAQPDIKPDLGASTSSQPQKKWMSVLNEGCMSTKGERVWQTASEGADHNKTWKATLMITNLGVSAIGEGKTKKLAQEEAARKVCERLNWTPGYKWTS